MYIEITDVVLLMLLQWLDILLQYMYNVVNEWCGHTNRENRQLAFVALEAFLKQVNAVHMYKIFCRSYV